jgi:hypothetical protein
MDVRRALAGNAPAPANPHPPQGEGAKAAKPRVPGLRRGRHARGDEEGNGDNAGACCDVRFRGYARARRMTGNGWFPADQKAGSLPSPMCNWPWRTVNHCGWTLRRSTKCHCGCPSVVENDRKRTPLSNVITTSGKTPKSPRSSIRAFRKLSNAGSQRLSSLQLPHRIVVWSSMRQLHSTPKDTSPTGWPGDPSRRGTGDRFPHSMKTAEP